VLCSARVGFGSSYKRVMSFSSVSHAWIELHRLVEAYSRTVGIPFREVFAELEKRFGFAREVRTRWPDIGTIRLAAAWLRARRQRVLEERRAWIAARRHTKAAGRGGPAPAGLREMDARIRAYAASVPRLGCWGWRARREQALVCTGPESRDGRVTDLTASDRGRGSIDP
jgi:hypothetical protein